LLRTEPNQTITNQLISFHTKIWTLFLNPNSISNSIKFTIPNIIISLLAKLWRNNLFNESYWLRRLDTTSQNKQTRLTPEKRTKEGIEGYINNSKKIITIFFINQKKQSSFGWSKARGLMNPYYLTVSNLYYFSL